MNMSIFKQMAKVNEKSVEGGRLATWPTCQSAIETQAHFCDYLIYAGQNHC
ncbi:MAG TPA: hypothetical protein VM163_09200 [bacterium]|nr:hypothetical protein [bacterium]